MAKFIFVTGGVVSSLGKGLAAASLGAVLQARGYKVRLRKLDPYLNVDPGTMSPTQHGEVFVTDDGAETDLDLGHYERFTGVSARKTDCITTGKIYSNVIAKERRGDYLGATVQVVPHITNEIKDFILGDVTDEDFVICEVGGTVGDIEGLPYLEAFRQLRNDLDRMQTMFVHLTLVPYIPSAGELKTKPSQHSVKELQRSGIQPDLLLCRSDREIPQSDRNKLALFCNVREENVVQALDVKSIYQVPLSYHHEGMDRAVCKHFNLPHDKAVDFTKWNAVVDSHLNPETQVEIAVVGKYTSLQDAYKSLNEAIVHGGISNHTKTNITYVSSEDIEKDGALLHLKNMNAVIVPGAFGTRGAEGKIKAIQFARENNIPYLGICFGMQMAVIEAARNLVGLTNAVSSEFGKDGEKIVGLMTEWDSEAGKQKRAETADLGGTMRLGSYPCVLKAGTLAEKIYGSSSIGERHRHRYEVNIRYKENLEKQGLIFSGLSPDGSLPEIVEYNNHPWFVAVQFHPELKSKPFEPHPLFHSLVAAATQHNKES